MSENTNTAAVTAKAKPAKSKPAADTADKSVKVKIINKSRHPNPEYKTPGAAGFDIRAKLDVLIKLKPLQRHLVPTGIYLEIPDGYEAQVRPRSGLASAEGVTVLNAPGTIDSDFRGEVLVNLVNLSDVATIIRDGDRIAQVVISKAERAKFVDAEKLSETERGEGGHGSTGRV
jgi:dUTP pyrophosphatase